jgi:hypothetical protein
MDGGLRPTGGPHRRGVHYVPRKSEGVGSGAKTADSRGAPRGGYVVLGRPRAGAGRSPGLGAEEEPINTLWPACPSVVVFRGPESSRLGAVA